jgi:signal transduction histidine kinase
VIPDRRLIQMALQQDTDVVLSRNRARIIAEGLGFERNDQVRVATAVSEIARNAYRYAKQGLVTFAVTTEASAQNLLITIADSGPGISDLDSVLSGSYRSRTGMGMGIRGAHRLMDRVEIDTGSQGTTVRLWQKLPRGRSASPEDLQRISEGLSEAVRRNPLDELAVQNRDLTVSLEEISEQRLTLAEVNEELKETNRGVVALYDELETVHRLGRVVASRLDMDSLLSAITDATTDLSSAEFGAFFYASGDSQNLVCQAVSGRLVQQPSDLKPLAASSLDLPENGDVVQFDESKTAELARVLGLTDLRSLLACPVLDASGDLMGALVFGHSEPGVFTERTERILSTVAVQASVGIANARLYRNVQTANDAKAQFLAVLSHELRTPLNPVFAILSTFEEQPDLPPQMRDDLHVMRRNLQLEARLIDDLLDLTRISEGKMPFEQEVMDLHQIAAAAVQTCRSEMDRKPVRLKLLLSASRHHVLGDATRLQQVFWNLLNNAIKFSPAGGLLTVRTVNLTEDAVTLSVSDEGRGMEPSALDRVFSPFEQEDLGVTSRFGGLGLGLAISRGIISAHRGSIRAESEGLNRGATIVVTLPVVEAPQMEFEQTKPDVLTEEKAALRILLVDDHDDTRMIMGRILSMRGFEVSEAASVAEAFAKFEAQPFDLVISDLGLPDGSGHDLMERMRAIRPVKGIALSGYGMETDVDRSHAAGFLKHLTKPVEMKHLDDAIREVMAS